MHILSCYSRIHIRIILMVTIQVITTVLFLGMKWKAKNSINPIVQVVDPNIQNRANPNIGCDGRNVSLLGTCGTSLFASIFAASILLLLIKFLTDSIANAIFLVPVVTISFIWPSIFYFNNPKSFGIIKDILF